MRIQTQNLTLSFFTTHDAPFYKTLVNTPGWIREIGDRNIHTDEEAKTYLLNGIMKGYTDHGYAPMLVSLTAGNIPIGLCGLINRGTLDHCDIGFAFLPDYEGKGYAYEASAAILAYARNDLHLQKVVAILLPTNTRSAKLLQRLGFIFEKMIHLPGDEEELMLMSTQF